MYKIMPMTAALALALSLPQASLAQDNNGRGHGGGHEQGGNGRGQDGNGRGNDNKGGGKGDKPSNHGPQRQANDDRGRPNPPAQRADNDGRGRGHGADDNRRGPVEREVRRVERDFERVVDTSRDRHTVYLRREPDRILITGCPPGLARKDNGCLPPGQARKLEHNRYDYLWRARDDRYSYRYDEGYLYRLSPQGSLLGYLPVLGGALAPGRTWPAQYAYDPVPEYYTGYYRLNDRYNYRYADGALYGLDPQTQAISQVAALLTGQQWNVGQRMPAGYDVYNVPYAYRGQYADSADRMYRYDDGYVYQVDPTTQLVQAVIQLLT